MFKPIFLTLWILILSSASNAQTDLEELRIKAEETSNAFFTGNLNKFVDLTYPKVVELMGGRAKMISLIENGLREMKAQGFEMSAASFESPKEVVAVGSQLFAIVPYTLKMKAPGGILTQQSYMLGISNSGVTKWTFIDATNVDEAKLKIVLPGAVGRLTLPKKQPPVFQQTP